MERAISPTSMDHNRRLAETLGALARTRTCSMEMVSTSVGVRAGFVRKFTTHLLGHGRINTSLMLATAFLGISWRLGTLGQSGYTAFVLSIQTVLPMQVSSSLATKAGIPTRDLCRCNSPADSAVTHFSTTP